MTKKYIIIILVICSTIFGQNLSEKPKKPFMNTDDISFLGTSNRITSILDEAKQFLSDAIIADVNLDTVEVVYNIKKVFLLEDYKFSCLCEGYLNILFYYYSNLKEILIIFSDNFFRINKKEIKRIDKLVIELKNLKLL